MNELDKYKPFDLKEERTAAMRTAEKCVQSTDTLDGCPHNRPTNIMSWWREQHPEQVTKPVTPPPPPPKTTVVREEVKDIIRAHREQHGVYPSIAEVTKDSSYALLLSLLSLR